MLSTHLETVGYSNNDLKIILFDNETTIKKSLDKALISNSYYNTAPILNTHLIEAIITSPTEDFNVILTDHQINFNNIDKLEKILKKSAIPISP
ncbi:MAG: hypothetical protein KAS49_05790 [Candidatus Cloacimonetes bacterium]|nr:hypothetical protein [Candidatus Cloacimonadota bacterium]